MKQVNRLILLSVLIIPAAAFAQNLPPPQLPVITDPSDLTAMFQNLMGVWIASVSNFAYEVFWALAGVDFAFLGWNLWREYRGDIAGILTGVTNKMLVTGMFLALLMNGSTWMAWIINSFITIGKNAAGVPSLAPSVILLQGVKIFGNLFGAAVSAGLWLDLANAIALIFAAACILLSFIVITCQFIITQVQIFLSLGMGYFFLAFGGSKFTTPYVERYFALSIGIGIRMMTLYLLVGGGWFITNTWANRASQIGLTAAGIQQAWIIAAVSIIYGFVCWYVPSFIGAMMSGSPTLSHTDMLAFTAPVAMGAIAMMTGGSGVAAAVTSAGSGGGGVLAGGNTPPSSPPSGGTPSSSPVSSPTGGSGGAGASTGVSVAAGVMRGAGTVASRMPSSGSAGSTPHFSGFGH